MLRCQMAAHQQPLEQQSCVYWSVPAAGDVYIVEEVVQYVVADNERWWSNNVIHSVWQQRGLSSKVESIWSKSPEQCLDSELVVDVEHEAWIGAGSKWLQRCKTSWAGLMVVDNVIVVDQARSHSSDELGCLCRSSKAEVCSSPKRYP